MAELQRTDDSLFSREKDEEKSLESFDDTISMLIESETVRNKEKGDEDPRQKTAMAMILALRQWQDAR